MDKTRLAYAHLEDGPHLLEAYLAAATARPRDAALDLRPIFGAAAVACLFAAAAATPLFEFFTRLRRETQVRRKNRAERNQ